MDLASGAETDAQRSEALRAVSGIRPDGNGSHCREQDNMP